ncbi:hypothetical protein B0H12DRAFT_815914 [Mycena haematopus]|nr:hypothetical protein B0H12DRAFT_815914 [Mycena haematopus]
MSTGIDPSSLTRWREYLSGLEQQYALPVKRFVTESYEQHPFATTVLVIFAASGFVPVAVLAAIAVFTICTAVSLCLLILLGLALCLVVLLSTVLLYSTVITLLCAGAIRLRQRSPGGFGWNFPAYHTSAAPPAPETSDPTSTPPNPNSNNGLPRTTPSPTANHTPHTRSFLSLLRVIRRSWKFILAAFLTYELLLGSHPLHILPYALSRPFALLRILAVVPFELLGWKATLAILVLLIPTIVRLARRERATPTQAQLRALLEKARAASAQCAAVVAFLRAELEKVDGELRQWDAEGSASAPGVHVDMEPEAPLEREAQPEETTYEMVSPVVAGTSLFVPVEVSTLRARKVSESGGRSEDE